MLAFQNDYSHGAHPKVLEHLINTNLEPLSGYGTDIYTEKAKEKIRKACGCAEADIYFLSGGTQTNQVVISSMLHRTEGVVSAVTGHIAQHEAGAIEYTGHKVLPIPQTEGKIKPQDLKNYLDTFYGDENHEPMVYPGMVYISHPTEYGTLYSKTELKELYEICNNFQIPLFLDGARLAYGIAGQGSDVTLEDIAKYCYCSSSTLSHVFAKNYGMTIGKLIHTVRCDRAKVLLIESSMSIGQIALECGFSSADYFTSVFKNLTGVTPTEYRTAKTT